MLNNFLLWGIKRRIRGFGLFVRMFYPDGRIVVLNRYGVKFYTNPYEKIDDCIIRHGYFDHDVILALDKHTRDGDIYWDIGANIGLHALTLKYKYPKVQIVCFEPYYDNFRQLIRNKDLNELDIDCYNVALNDTPDLHYFYTIPGNSGATGFIKVSGSISTNFGFASTTAESISNHRNEVPNVIKIDTEGKELSILMGMKAILKSSKLRVIVLECNQDLGAIESYLAEFGFSLTRLSEAPNFIALRSL